MMMMMIMTMTIMGYVNDDNNCSCNSMILHEFTEYEFKYLAATFLIEMFEF